MFKAMTNCTGVLSERKFVDAVPMDYGRGATGGKRCKGTCVMSVDTCMIPRQATWKTEFSRESLLKNWQMIGSALYAGWVRKFFPRSDQRFYGLMRST